MSRHTTYRGIAIDMDTMRRDNESVPALGNMKVNAGGDQISGGIVTKTVGQIAREGHSVQSTIVKSGLKGSVSSAPVAGLDTVKQPVRPTSKKVRETELPSKDILVDDGE